MPDTNSLQILAPSSFLKRSSLPFGLPAHASDPESWGAAALVTAAAVLLLGRAAVSDPRDARQRRRPQPLLVGLGCAPFDPPFGIVSDS